MNPGINPDHALLLDFLRAPPGAPWPVHTNALAQELGTTLIAADAEAGTLSLCFTPDARFVQGNGAVQGGIVTAMLDFAAAFVVLMKLPPERAAVTAALDVQFLRAARAGRFVAHARIKRLGATLAFAAAELRGADEDQACASASAVLPLTHPRPQPRRDSAG
ncbi:PaaI family thioesterase [Aquabacterium sp.]|uniref:PaaI family thioesterase n=1 Tax=Aquabacterium sp. TaxID=1872578 RepID=UPI002D0438F5|nr:PaaI family thioesterase [Aquabacterium sp.]HSW06738.1 PaaI family thioesterase [Aquabacterium sp.]